MGMNWGREVTDDSEATMPVITASDHR
jgi:hypothetical protein